VYFSISLLVTSNTRWAQDGITVASGHGEGDGFQQIYRPYGLVMNDDGTVLIADAVNNCIVAWKKGDNVRHVVAGGQGKGSELNQLNGPTDVLIDSESNSLIVCDRGNRRIVRWPLNNHTQGEVLVDNIYCSSLAMNKHGCLCISDIEAHEVRRFTRDTKGLVVAGGNGEGSHLNQLNWPCDILVDGEQSVYLSHWNNHRVMKWLNKAKEGIVVTGGKEAGKELTQLHTPRGVWVYKEGLVYLAEWANQRVTRWPKGEARGVVLLGGNGRGDATNQLNRPEGLSFDRAGNLYVIDCYNHRLQQLKLENN
jgi:sugar lactone lactonase YvrE